MTSTACWPFAGRCAGRREDADPCSRSGGLPGRGAADGLAAEAVAPLRGRIDALGRDRDARRALAAAPSPGALPGWSRCWSRRRRPGARGDRRGCAATDCADAFGRELGTLRERPWPGHVPARRGAAPLAGVRGRGRGHPAFRDRASGGCGGRSPRSSAARRRPRSPRSARTRSPTSSRSPGRTPARPPAGGRRWADEPLDPRRSSRTTRACGAPSPRFDASAHGPARGLGRWHRRRRPRDRRPEAAPRPRAPRSGVNAAGHRGDARDVRAHRRADRRRGRASRRGPRSSTRSCSRRCSARRPWSRWWTRARRDLAEALAASWDEERARYQRACAAGRRAAGPRRSPPSRRARGRSASARVPLDASRSSVIRRTAPARRQPGATDARLAPS